MKNQKTEHTGMRNEMMFCYNCGRSQKLPLPMDIRIFAALAKAFSKIHRKCEKTWTQPVNDPNEKLERENLKWWIENGEQGTSSKTMVKYLSTSIEYYVKHECHPHDPDDFRRCHLLMEAVPQFKSKIRRMKSVSKTWSNLIDNWDKLTKMLKSEEIAMYSYMKKLGC